MAYAKKRPRSWESGCHLLGPTGSVEFHDWTYFGACCAWAILGTHVPTAHLRYRTVCAIYRAPPIDINRCINININMYTYIQNGMQCLVAPPRNGLLVPFPVVSLGCSFPGSLLYSLWTSSSIPIFGCCVPSLVVGRIANVCRRMQRDWNAIGTWFVNQFKNTSFGCCVPSFGPRRLYSCFLLVFWIRWHKPCFFPLPSIRDPL